MIMIFSFIPKCIKTHADFMKQIHCNFRSSFSLLRNFSYVLWLKTRLLLTSKAFEMERTDELKYTWINLMGNHVYVTNTIKVPTCYKIPSLFRTNEES